MAAGEGSGGAFPWTGDVDRGAWIAERLDGGWRETGSGADGRVERYGPALGQVVPSGFEALVRVLHPFRRDLPTHGTWPEYWRLQDELQAASERGEQVDWSSLQGIRDEPVTWAAAAVAHSAELTPDALAFRLLGFEHYGEQSDGTEVNADGWRYELPAEGRLDSAVLTAVARVLAAHTETPDRGVAAVWEGYAGLVSAQGVAYFDWADEPESSLPAWLRRLQQRWVNRTLGFRMFRERFGTRAALHARFLPRVQQPAGSGLLSKEAATGPRLELPDRAYVCFEAGIAEFGDADWAARAPWVEPSEAGRDPQSPNVIWPEDRAWLLVSEIDFDSTLIACSRACADALLAAHSHVGTDALRAAEGIETVEMTRDTPLWSV